MATKKSLVALDTQSYDGVPILQIAKGIRAFTDRIAFLDVDGQAKSHALRYARDLEDAISVIALNPETKTLKPRFFSAGCKGRIKRFFTRIRKGYSPKTTMTYIRNVDFMSTYIKDQEVRAIVRRHLATARKLYKGSVKRGLSLGFFAANK